MHLCSIGYTLCFLNKADELSKRHDYENATSHYYAILYHIGIIPEKDKLEFPQQTGLRLEVIKNIAFVYYKDTQWNKCIDKCQLILNH